MSKGGKGGDGGAGQARADEQARQERIRSGTESINKTFDQFDDGFYSRRRDAALNYYNPQLEDQYAKAKRELAFSLDSAGTTNSSIRAQKESELAQLFDTNKRQVADQAMSMANNARSNVEGARSELVSSLNASGDAEQASRSAIARAGALSAADGYSPIPQLFSTFTGALGQQAANERAEVLSQGATRGRYYTGLFDPNPDAVKYTRK